MESVQLILKNIRTYYLVSAIANIVAFLIGAFTVVLAGIGTFGCGCVLIVLPVVNLVVMIFDFVAFSRVLDLPTPRVYSFLKMVAVLDMLAGFALVPLIMGILNTQNLGNPEVHAYYHAEATE